MPDQIRHDIVITKKGRSFERPCESHIIFLQFIQLAVLTVEVIHQRFVCQRFPGDLLDQIIGPVTLSVAVNILPQPSEQRFEIAGGELRIEIAEILFRFGPREAFLRDRAIDRDSNHGTGGLTSADNV